MPTARVLEVIDGKSLLIFPKWEWGNISGCVLRLKDVVAPDRSEPGGAEAKAAHQKISEGKLIDYEGEKIDRHQRLIASVKINDVSVNETMTERGWRK